MLRSMCMKNFINFRDRQELKFQEGVNFIIGANSTGKTACFELLRRCLSNKINKTTSSIPDKQKLAYVVCHFQISENFPEKDVKHVIACLFVEQVGELLNKNDCFFYKVLCSVYSNETGKVRTHKFRGRYGCETNDFKKGTYHELELHKLNETLLHIRNIIEGKSAQENEISLFDKIRESTISNGSDATTMDSMYQWLEDRYVGVMPMRSIGPTQWTRSPNLQSDENYEIANNRAEILNALLGDAKINEELENMYHQKLVYPFQFKKRDNGIYVQNIEKKKKSDPFPLLKSPEGIIEAKQLTLILSHEEFSTITLEEPDRGMHPHMIKKMRDLVFRQVKGKTVLIITHNISMVNPWSMSRSFICSKRGDTENIMHYIRQVPKERWNDYGRNEEMKCVLFSPRICFVEGPTDKIVFDAIFSYLTTSQNFSIKQQLIEYVLSTEVLELQSATHGDAKINFCNKLMKEVLTIYDFDVFKNGFKPSESGKVRVCGDKARVDFNKEYNNLEEFRKKDFAKFEEACENSQVFCWREGALEYQIISIRDKLDREVFRRIFGNDENEIAMRKYFKKHLKEVEPTYIEKLAAALVQFSEEINRFIQFLEKMTRIIGGKRKSSDAETTTIYKRQRSTNVEENMLVDNTNNEAGSGNPKVLHTGLSDVLENMPLD